jgi:hypothetical protein
LFLDCLERIFTVKRFLSLKFISTATVAVALLLDGRSGLADPLTATNLNTPVITQYPADGGSVIAIPIELTNNNTFGVEILSLGNLSYSYDEGNPGDAVTGVSFDNDVSGNSNGNCYVDETLKKKGGSCTLELLITVTGVAPTKTHPDDLGVSMVTDALIVDTGGSDFGGVQHVGADFGVEVQDTPEPGSLILLGTGILGLAGVMRRKVSRS